VPFGLCSGPGGLAPGRVVLALDRMVFDEDLFSDETFLVFDVMSRFILALVRGSNGTGRYKE
jgi:hypothetical protein